MMFCLGNLLILLFLSKQTFALTAHEYLMQDMCTFEDFQLNQHELVDLMYSHG